MLQLLPTTILQNEVFSKLHHNFSQAWHAITSFLSNTTEKNLSLFQQLIPVALICIEKVCSFLMTIQMLSLDVPSVKRGWNKVGGEFDGVQ